MRSFATICLLSAAAISGHTASEFNLKGFDNPAPKRISTLKFGKSDRRRANGNEALTLTLSNGEDIVLSLAPSEELRRIETCGSYSLEGSDYDVIVTGCEGDDRSITIGGEGSWAYDASSESFRRLEKHNGPDTALMPPDDDEDAMTMKHSVEEAEATGELIKANLEDRSQFQMEVRYYYDQSLLEKYNGDHEQAVKVIKEMHEHTKVMMRHPSIGRAVHINYSVEPKFASALRTHAGPDTALDEFMDWLSPQGLCTRDIAFHHLITNRRRDGTSGVAWVGTVCHGNCFNTGITEVWSSTLDAAQTMAHEFGHNLGALHTFSSQNQGRDCHGIMSYGERPSSWSDCSKERWTSDYDVFVRSFGQTRADQCFKPTSKAPVPAPTPAGPAPTPTGPATPDGPSPTPFPAGMVVVTVGTSFFNTKVVRHIESDLKCPEIVNKDNWIGGSRQAGEFEVTVTGKQIKVTRKDSIFGWSMPLAFHCIKEDDTAAPAPTPAAPSPTPAAPAPTAPPSPTPAAPAPTAPPAPRPTPKARKCQCAGKTNSLGEGGDGCDSFTADSAKQWCYTEVGACRDGKSSNKLGDYEWSFKACK